MKPKEKIEPIPPIDPVIEIEEQELEEVEPVKRVARARKSKNEIFPEFENDQAGEEGRQGPVKEEEEPVVVVEKDPLIRWKKLGGGTIRLRNPDRIIKPNQVFTAKLSDIPKAFMDVVEALEDVGQIERQIVQAKVPTFNKVQVEDGLFNVVSSYGKIINQTPMSSEDADYLIKNLS